MCLHVEGHLRNFSLGQKIQIAMETAEGIEHAHSRGVLHRDIKSANILVKQQQPFDADIKICPNNTVKIADFGLAHSTNMETAQGTRYV